MLCKILGNGRYAIMLLFKIRIVIMTEQYINIFSELIPVTDPSIIICVDSMVLAIFLYCLK